MDAVRDFEGAALVVAHDEHFLNEVATKLIVFKNGRVFFYPGTYREFLESVGWEDDDGLSTVKVPPVISIPSSEPVVPQQPVLPAVPPKTEAERVPKGHKSKMTRKARAEFVAMRSKCLKPLEEKVRSLENAIISSEARVAAVNEELIRFSVKGGPGALRRSELSRELKELAEKIDFCYSELDAAMKIYDAAKRKYSDEEYGKDAP